MVFISGNSTIINTTQYSNNNIDTNGVIFTHNIFQGLYIKYHAINVQWECADSSRAISWQALVCMFICNYDMLCFDLSYKNMKMNKILYESALIHKGYQVQNR